MYGRYEPFPIEHVLRDDCGNVLGDLAEVFRIHRGWRSRGGGLLDDFGDLRGVYHANHVNSSTGVNPTGRYSTETLTCRAIRLYYKNIMRSRSAASVPPRVVKKSVVLHPIMDRAVRQIQAMLLEAEPPVDATYSTALNFMLVGLMYEALKEGGL